MPLVHIHQHKAGSIPNLVGKVPGCLHLAFDIAGIVSGADPQQQGEAQCIRTILVNHFQRIHAVPQRLGHLPSLLITHKAVNQHRLERHIPHLLHAGEDHPGNPEENNVIARHQHAGGIEVLQVFRFLRPAQGREGPQGTGEPGIQHFLILMDVLAAALGAVGQIRTGNAHFAAVIAVPGRNPMTPPQLAADAPVTDVLHPVQVRLGEAIRHEGNAAILDALNGRLCQGLHVHKPLLGHHGFHSGVAAVASAHLMLQGLHRLQVATCRQVGDNGLPCLCSSHAGILAAVQHTGLVHRSLAGGEQLVILRLVCCASHMSVIGKHTDNGQLMPLSHFIVVRVVGRGNLHHAGALGHVRMLVAHNGDFLVQQGQNHVAPMEMGIPGILCIDGHCRIAQHGFRTGGGQLQHFPGLLHRVEQVPEVAVLLFILHLRIGNGRIAAGTPVHQTTATVNQTLFIQAAEHFPDSPAAAFIHSEAFTAPVAACAHAPLLLGDAVAVLLLPCPGTLQERFPANAFLGQAFLGHGSHDLHFRCNGGVIRARQPQGGITLHAVIANGRILQGAVHGVTHMKLPRNVRRRHHNGKGLLALFTVRHKGTAFFPFLIELRFNGLGIKLRSHIRAGHFCFHLYPSLP